MTNNIPYLRKKIPTLLALSATAFALLITSPMLFFNPLVLQPVQAQTAPTSFRTPEPAKSANGSDTTLTFDAHVTNSSSSNCNYPPMDGTFQVANSSDGQIVYSGVIECGLIEESNPVYFAIVSHAQDVILTHCVTSNANPITLLNSADFQGAVECDTGGGGGGNTTAQPSPSPSSSLTGSPQVTDRGSSSSSGSSNSSNSSNSKDGDRDGVPDSSDRCTHNSNPKCFKEAGGTSSGTTTPEQQPSSSSSSTSSSSSGNETTTTHERQQPSSSSSISGNQTR